MKNQRLLSKDFVSHYEREIWELEKFTRTKEEYKNLIQSPIIDVIYAETSSDKPFLYIVLQCGWCIILDYYKMKALNAMPLSIEKAKIYYGWIKRPLPEHVKHIFR